ncbi:Cytochrome c peroxidase [Microbulbifer donghaiensis]|uniref:Cytochrome c peroxidase n=1 Tax=Microbulbifer donghaiensis TaxID=494016 RepID=A0A1M4V9R0_9GAMM|nr:cytochrome c peroxidase [Microbulbifer donghaiensis]SHE65731.1 Cytochrome c peroxidase [Microbulbifer donghaiensis]
MERSERKRQNFLMPASAVLLTMAFGVNAVAEEEAILREQALKVLGKHVFFDTDLSMPKGNQACVSCHEPFAGGTSGFSDVNETTVGVPGANFDTDPTAIGGRKPPSNTYATFSPSFSVAPFPPSPDGPCFGLSVSGFCGGNFWDGRSQGESTDGLIFRDAGTAGPHLGMEVFYNIENAAIMAFAKYRGPTSDQALNPMPNAVEQNIGRKEVCELVAESTYSPLYKLAWGEDIDCSSTYAYLGETHYDISFKRMMLAVGAYQHSEDINSFSSKRDIALRSELACDGYSFPEHYNPAVCKKLYKSGKEPGKFPLMLLTDQENEGHDLFYGEAGCQFCHSNKPTIAFGPFNFPGDDGTELEQTYTDHGYHNIGVPVNALIPKFNGPDTGANNHQLGALDGLHRTPTLRNVTKGEKSNFVKAYTHSGWFKTLEGLVHFYNTSRNFGDEAGQKKRCEELFPEQETFTMAEALANNCWPAPEFNTGLAPANFVGNIGLTEDQEAALVAYIKTLNDQHTAKTPVLVKSNSFHMSPVAMLFATEKWSEEICEMGTPSNGVYSVKVKSPKNCVRFKDLLDILGEGYWVK